MKKNTIYTDTEYMAQGFKAWEVPMIRRHDELFNMLADGIITEEQEEEMATLQKQLGL